MKRGINIIKVVVVKVVPFVIERINQVQAFYQILNSPARNAFLKEGIDTLQKLSQFTEKEILNLHGIGPTSIPIMRAALEEEGVSFRE